MEQLRTFLDICTPQARLARPLSKNGYSTIESFLATRTGHHLNLARMVTGGSTPACWLYLLHAKMAAEISSTGCKSLQETRPEKKTQVEAGESGAGAVAGCAGRGRGRPRNPPAEVECDSPEQATVRPILGKMQVGQMLQLCSKMNVDCWQQILKEDLLTKFMKNHDAVFSAYLHLQADGSATFTAAATMTPPPPPVAATLSPPLPPQPQQPSQPPPSTGAPPSTASRRRPVLPLLLRKFSEEKRCCYRCLLLQPILLGGSSCSCCCQCWG